MADNIKIIGDIYNTRRISRINSEDLNLIPTIPQNKTFGADDDYIQYMVYDDQGEILYSLDNYKNYKLPSVYPLSSDGTLPVIEINPIQDLENLGYISGQFTAQYNFNKSIISGPTPILFIDEISEDRTEIRLNSTILSTEQLTSWGQYLGSSLENSNEQINFILNFPNNQQLLIINVAIDYNSVTPTLLLKLYNPLPLDIAEKTSGWISEDIIEPYVFTINLDSSVLLPPVPQLKGPNFDIELDIKQNVSTKYESYSSLVSSLTGSSYHKVLNYMNDNSYDLNIDYTSFSNFIHFSSAKKRLEVFYGKVKQIEDYNSDIDLLLASNSILKNEETASIKLKIDNIAKNFDGFENYLYFESSSYAWPKTSNVKPYTLQSTGSATLVSWYNSYTGSAELYDENNLDHLYNVIPEYIKFDPDNYQPYYDFINMIGHYFDNIWIYIDSINELYNADNNLEKGVSKDIVYDALKSLGVKLYNSKGNDEFDNYIGGLNSGSTLFVDDFSATSSFLNNVPKKDQLAELYKRIYHNIPLLSKTKGTAAGLQNLITTFGVTSSIFSPKELGGSTRTGGLKGYDNDKITIQNNTITGSVLSPFISLQQPFTASTDFTSTDLHFIDLSFSPQTALDSRVSASIATSNARFSIDDYIGDPRLMESSSYDALDIQKQEYFINSGSITDRLDYKGFFELVKYFDNSLFKMLKDFVPARANALTGVTIKSPVLERNKIKVYQPKVTEETVHDAEYAAPVISEDRDYYYDKIAGNKSTFYTGEFTGSYANINDVFENSNPNPYLHPTKSVDINIFNHTDFNIMLNNVSESIKSVNRTKVENLYNRSLQIIGSYSSSAELQDSQLNLSGHKNSRYDGVKLSSRTYNTYSSSSVTYSGDISYGKTAVIDHNTRKIGLFSQIQNNKFFALPRRSNVALKYLVDENGNLTELNKRNKHWYELQNTFKTGDHLVVSLLNNQKTQNQRYIDGSKHIFNSGYGYSPILYASSSDASLYFSYTGDSISKLFRINTISGFISGSSSNTYPITSGKIFDIFNKNPSNGDPTFEEGNAYYDSPTIPATYFPTYSISETGNQRFNAIFDVNVEFPTINQSGSFTFNINKVGGSNLATQTLAITSSAVTTVLTTGYSYAVKQGDTFTPTYDVIVKDGGGTPTGEILYAGVTTLRKIIASPEVQQGSGFCSPRFTAEFYVKTDYYNSIITSYCNNPLDIYNLPTLNKQLYQLPQNALSKTLNFSVSSSYQEFSLNEKVAFEFSIGPGGFNTNNFTASISNGGTLYNQLAANQAGTNPFANNDTSPFISGSEGGSVVVLNSSLSYFQDYQYLPSGSSFLNSLYTTYGEIDYVFSPKQGDIIMIYYGTSGNFIESEIKQVSKSNDKIYLTLSSELPSALNIPTYTNSTVSKFLILSKIDDETNIILNFNKRDDIATSLGFILPNNLHPDVLANIDIITKEVKQKLIDLGSTEFGGTF